jgi:hypothetical protein
MGRPGLAAGRRGAGTLAAFWLPVALAGALFARGVFVSLFAGGFLAPGAGWRRAAAFSRGLPCWAGGRSRRYGREALAPAEVKRQARAARRRSRRAARRPRGVLARGRVGRRPAVARGAPVGGAGMRGAGRFATRRTRVRVAASRARRVETGPVPPARPGRVAVALLPRREEPAARGAVEIGRGRRTVVATRRPPFVASVRDGACARRSPATRRDPVAAGTARPRDAPVAEVPGRRGVAPGSRRSPAEVRAPVAVCGRRTRWRGAGRWLRPRDFEVRRSAYPPQAMSTPPPAAAAIPAGPKAWPAAASAETPVAPVPCTRTCRVVRCRGPRPGFGSGAAAPVVSLLMSSSSLSSCVVVVVAGCRRLGSGRSRRCRGDDCG